MAPYVPKIGDYVSWETGSGDDKKTLYGRVAAAVSGSNVKVEFSDSSEYSDEASAKTAGGENVPVAKLKKSTWAKMKMRAAPNGWEVAYNVTASSLYHTFLKKGNHFMGCENVSFALADITHEYLTKGMAEKIADMFLPTTLKKDVTDIFQMSDLSDAARKVGFVVALQQLFQNLIYKKSFNHQIMSNLAGGFGILYVSNAADRMYNAESDKDYTYP